MTGGLSRPARGSVFTSWPGIGLVIALLASLLALSIAIQLRRDARFLTDAPAEQILYVQSPETVKRLVLSYDDLAADVYWIRALQQFGKTRIEDKTPQQETAPFEVMFPLLSEAAPFGVPKRYPPRYQLLYPLLDMATTLDPLFNIAYRFGAIFLSEPPPGGPGRPELAVALLEKGIKAAPTRWQYYQDAGFVNYWARRDYAAAADWFSRASRIEGAPWWLKPLAANTLAIGGSREASRTLYQSFAQSAENDFMRADALRRLKQLDALDQRDALQALVRRYQATAGTMPSDWQALIQLGLLKTMPTDPDGFPFVILPSEGEVLVHPRSTLQPMPEDPAAPRPPA